jgi:hypothetical protein
MADEVYCRACGWAIVSSEPYDEDPSLTRVLMVGWHRRPECQNVKLHMGVAESAMRIAKAAHARAVEAKAVAERAAPARHSALVECDSTPVR